MTELTEDKIKQAGKPSMILLWRRIYNSLCRSCQRKIFITASNVRKIGTSTMEDRVKKVIDEQFCTVCKRMIDLIMKKEGD